MMTGYKKIEKKSFFRAMLFVIALFLAPVQRINAAYVTNFFRPQDVAFFPSSSLKSRAFIAGAFVEHGFSSVRGYDEDGKVTDLLKIYNPIQSAQAMLADSHTTFLDSENPERWFANPVQQTYDGEWGQFQVSGKFQQSVVTFWIKGALPVGDFFPGKFSIAAYLPIKSCSVDDVDWKDLSNPYVLGGEERINGFTSRLKEFAMKVGKLDLHRWSKVGQGDLTIMLDWNHGFKQELDFIKRIRLEAGFGVVIPTARSVDSDVNHVFAIPFGTDTSWGIPVKGCLEMGVHDRVSVGVGVDMLWLSDITKTRRLKTDPAQTDCLLLSKGRVRMQHARTWRFSLFSSIDLPVDGLSVSALYHFSKTGDHTLIPEDNDFNNSVVNSSESIKESSTHDIVFKGSFASENKGGFTAPSFSGFVKVPVGGMRSIKAMTWGGEFTFAF
ncbi:hypothetical protein FJ366_04185 [Candidatus Dependentiae bacterium]|nr:hypothetical protein [Candidatus Dependentiae bacterium]